MAHRQLRAEVTVHESEEREPDRAHPNPHGCPLRLRSAAQRLVVLSACVREPSWLRGGRQPRGHGHPVWHQLARDESGAGRGCLSHRGDLLGSLLPRQRERRLRAGHLAQRRAHLPQTRKMRAAVLRRRGRPAQNRRERLWAGRPPTTELRSGWWVAWRKRRAYVPVGPRASAQRLRRASPSGSERAPLSLARPRSSFLPPGGWREAWARDLPGAVAPSEVVAGTVERPRLD